MASHLPLDMLKIFLTSSCFHWAFTRFRELTVHLKSYIIYLGLSSVRHIISIYAYLALWRSQYLDMHPVTAKHIHTCLELWSTCTCGAGLHHPFSLALEVTPMALAGQVIAHDVTKLKNL
jgi:hypothetical protein